MSRKQVHAELISNCSPRPLQDALHKYWRGMRSSFALSASRTSIRIGGTDREAGHCWQYQLAPEVSRRAVARSYRQAGKVSGTQKPYLGPQRCGRTTRRPRRRGRTSAPAACEPVLPTHCCRPEQYRGCPQCSGTGLQSTIGEPSTQPGASWSARWAQEEWQCKNLYWPISLCPLSRAPAEIQDSSRMRHCPRLLTHESSKPSGRS